MKLPQTFKIPGTDVILKEGQEIEVLEKENLSEMEKLPVDMEVVKQSPLGLTMVRIKSPEFKRTPVYAIYDENGVIATAMSMNVLNRTWNVAIKDRKSR